MKMKLGSALDVVDAEVLAGHGQDPFEDVPAVALVRLAFRGQDVAEHHALPPDGLLRKAPVGPGQDAEGRRVGLDDEVAFLDPDEPLDRRAVEALSLLEGGFEFRGGEGEIHGPAQDVGEDDPDELDLMFGVENRIQNLLDVLKAESFQGTGIGMHGNLLDWVGWEAAPSGKDYLRRADTLCLYIWP